MRKEILKVESVEAEKRKKQVDNMGRIVKARAKLEKEHFDERQKVREKLIELATKDLETRKMAEDTILEKHKAETEVKYQEEMERRRVKKQLGMNAIDKSRSMQIKLKNERKLTEKQQAQLLAEHWKTHNDHIEKEEAKEAQDKWDKLAEIRKSQEAQVRENER